MYSTFINWSEEIFFQHCKLSFSPSLRAKTLEFPFHLGRSFEKSSKITRTISPSVRGKSQNVLNSWAKRCGCVPPIIASIHIVRPIRLRICNVCFPTSYVSHLSDNQHQLLEVWRDHILISIDKTFAYLYKQRYYYYLAIESTGINVASVRCHRIPWSMIWFLSSMILHCTCESINLHDTDNLILRSTRGPDILFLLCGQFYETSQSINILMSSGRE